MLERDIVAAIKRYLLTLGSDVFFWKEHGGPYGTSGIPDIIICYKGRFIGMECVDKVTGFRGMCIGRYVWLFNCDQYVLEFQPDEKTRETKFNILDEGRIEIVPNSTKEIHPEEVASPRPGGVLGPDFYPREDVPVIITHH